MHHRLCRPSETGKKRTHDRWASRTLSIVQHMQRGACALALLLFLVAATASLASAGIGGLDAAGPLQYRHETATRAADMQQTDADGIADVVRVHGFKQVHFQLDTGQPCDVHLEGHANIRSAGNTCFMIGIYSSSMQY